MEKIITLRKALHSIAEISGHEEKTKALLMDFIQKNTSMTIHLCGKGFYAAHREKNPVLPSIALRADYDALAMPDGTARHLCGHEGHAAALCGAALLAEGQTFGRNVFFLFQPAEETGEGAAECIHLFESEKVDEIYGLHNLPGFPWGQIVTRIGTFACASRGMILRFVGKPAHAAYPEDGVSPHMAVGQILSSISSLCAPEKYEGMTLCTVIGVQMGEKAFGAAASEAEVWLTLRAERNRDLNALNDAVLNLAENLAKQYELAFDHELVDVFPATENDEVCTRKIIELFDAVELDVPMRWSEDFGHYLLHCPGAYLGIGAGESYPPLHTENYEFPDSLLEPSMQIWITLMKS